MRNNKMFNLNKKSIIYVVCPANKKTGGTELAHQLVKELNNIGKNAYITYYGANNFDKPINDAFLEYVNEYKLISDIEDLQSNVLIVPEINFDIINKYTSIQKAIWWMSVDNYVKNDGFFGACSIDGIYKALRGVLSGRLSIRKKGIDTTAIHFFQSEYAHDFLNKMGIENCIRLSDYINDSYMMNDLSMQECKRKDVVLYNPKKGFEFTSKLIKTASDIRWIPIENMTTEQVKAILGESKVYIDFGNHPGKDRFPREAAIMGCCIITGKRGSAQYYQDIPILDEFKFSEEETNLENIIIKIKNCLLDYSSESKKFDTYKQMISCEHELFKKDVRTIFE